MNIRTLERFSHLTREHWDRFLSLTESHRTVCFDDPSWAAVRAGSRDTMSDYSDLIFQEALAEFDCALRLASCAGIRPDGYARPADYASAVTSRWYATEDISR